MKLFIFTHYFRHFQWFIFVSFTNIIYSSSHSTPATPRSWDHVLGGSLQQRRRDDFFSSGRPRKNCGFGIFGIFGICPNYDKISMISSSSSHHQILLHHQSSIIKFPHDFKVMFFSKEGQCFSSQFFLRDLSPSNGPLVIQWPWQWPSKALDLLQQLRDQGLQASEPWIKTGCGDGMGLATAGDSEFYGFPMDVFYGCCWMYFE